MTFRNGKERNFGMSNNDNIIFIDILSHWCDVEQQRFTTRATRIWPIWTKKTFVRSDSVIITFSPKRFVCARARRKYQNDRKNLAKNCQTETIFLLFFSTIFCTLIKVQCIGVACNGSFFLFISRLHLISKLSAFGSFAAHPRSDWATSNNNLFCSLKREKKTSFTTHHLDELFPFIFRCSHIRRRLNEIECMARWCEKELLVLLSETMKFFFHSRIRERSPVCRSKLNWTHI